MCKVAFEDHPLSTIHHPRQSVKYEQIHIPRSSLSLNRFSDKRIVPEKDIKIPFGPDRERYDPGFLRNEPADFL